MVRLLGHNTQRLRTSPSGCWPDARAHGNKENLTLNYHSPDFWHVCKWKERAMEAVPGLLSPGAAVLCLQLSAYLPKSFWPQLLSSKRLLTTHTAAPNLSIYCLVSHRSRLLKFLGPRHWQPGTCRGSGTQEAATKALGMQQQKRKQLRSAFDLGVSEDRGYHNLGSL